jgi:hypothetical protein
MNLPKEKSKRNLDFSAQKLGLIGSSGIGKSEFFAQEDKALFIETEAGLNFLEVYKVPVRSWNDLRNTYAALKEAQTKGEFPYTMIVIDTIDRLVDLAEEEIISRGKEFYKNIADQINTIGEIPNGGGWAKTRELISNFFNKLESFGCAIAYIGHLSTKRIQEGVRSYDKNTISLWAGVGQDMLAWADCILHVESHLIGDRLVRTVYTRPTQTREAKSRGALVPDGLKWGDNAKENWINFRKLFN